jgi:SAM-dependent methyltransferase
LFGRDVTTFVRGELPGPPARVLEIGAGAGELALALRGDGYEVMAIDPASEAPAVMPVALNDFEAPAASFDAAVAVLSLHHVEPLAASCRRLGSLVRRGGTLVVDEFDVERFDERAAAWWLERRRAAHEHEPQTPSELVAGLRDHIHPVPAVREALGDEFALGITENGPYLHRWDLPDGLLVDELRLIEAGGLPATGVRFLGKRR